MAAPALTKERANALVKALTAKDDALLVALELFVKQAQFRGEVADQLRHWEQKTVRQEHAFVKPYLDVEMLKPCLNHNHISGKGCSVSGCTYKHICILCKRIDEHGAHFMKDGFFTCPVRANFEKGKLSLAEALGCSDVLDTYAVIEEAVSDSLVRWSRDKGKLEWRKDHQLLKQEDHEHLKQVRREEVKGDRDSGNRQRLREGDIYFPSRVIFIFQLELLHH